MVEGRRRGGGETEKIGEGRMVEKKEGEELE